MTHPTDDELEAMAAKLDRNGPSHVDADIWMSEAAAMLRACKGRVRVKPLEWEQARDGAGWHPQLTIAYCPVFEKRYYAEHPEKQAKIDASREARILAALEPAPDHPEWDAAIEAAAKACEGFTKSHHIAQDIKSGIFPSASHLPDAISAAIRTLKKGQTND